MRRELARFGLVMALFGAGALPGVLHAAEAEKSARSGHSPAGVAITVQPLTAKWRTAFYNGRGFTEAVIRPYVQACGFSFDMRNDGASALSVRLQDWRTMDASGKEGALRLPQTWDAEWEKAGIAEAGRIAFRWAQFQSEIAFEPGDWIMGMATLEARPAAPFRLLAVYRDEKGRHEILIENLACAAD
jgi:hypothetical protein